MDVYIQYMDQPFELESLYVNYMYTFCFVDVKLIVCQVFKRNLEFTVMLTFAITFSDLTIKYETSDEDKKKGMESQNEALFSGVITLLLYLC